MMTLNLCRMSGSLRLGLGPCIIHKVLSGAGGPRSFLPITMRECHFALSNSTSNKVSSNIGISPLSLIFPSRSLTCALTFTSIVGRRFYGLDSNDNGEEWEITPSTKIEKQLIKFMDMWKLKEAITLLRLAVENDIIPDQTVVLNLLQQLANLGEVDFLLEMRQFLLDEKLCSNTAFFTCLQQAYFNSGRVDEGVEFLRKFYHLSRKYQDVDTYFVLLTIMVLQHFPDKADLIDSFIKDLAEREIPDHEPRAALWKCYMLSENFTKAEDLMSEHGDEVKPFISAMINDICAVRNKVEVDRISIMGKLIDFHGLRIRQHVLLYETYLMLLMEKSQFHESLRVLEKAHKENIPLHMDKVDPILKVLQMALTSNSDEENESNWNSLKSIREWLESQEQN